MTRRTPLAVTLALMATLSLFFMMDGLVAQNDEVILEEDRQLRFIDVVEDIEVQEIRSIDRKVEPPPEVVEAPQQDMPEDLPQQRFTGPNTLNIGIGRAQMDSGVDLGILDLGQSQDGDYLPLVRVQPQYPMRAMQRRIEGSVLISLTVSADGTVAKDSVIILEAEPEGYFERAAIAAATKFKYKPKIVNGKAQAVSGVMYRFMFDLSNVAQAGEE